MSNRLRWAADSEHLGALIELRGIDYAMTYADLFGDLATLDKFRARMAPTVVLLGDRGLGDPTGLATWCDVEAHANGPAGAAQFLATQRAGGKVDPGQLTIYTGMGQLAAVETACGPHGWWRWIARWGDGLTAPGHPMAMLQFASDTMLGAEVDLSIIRQPGWHPLTP